MLVLEKEGFGSNQFVTSFELIQIYSAPKRSQKRARKKGLEARRGDLVGKKGDGCGSYPPEKRGVGGINYQRTRGMKKRTDVQKNLSD